MRHAKTVSKFFLIARVARGQARDLMRFAGGPSRIVAALLLGTLLAACGQRGPLYYPILPPVPGSPATSASASANAVLPVPPPLGSPQTRLLDGVPSTILVAPAVSLPEAGDTTLPGAAQKVPANTPAAGTSNGTGLVAPDTSSATPSGASTTSSGDTPP